MRLVLIILLLIPSQIAAETLTIEAESAILSAPMVSEGEYIQTPQDEAGTARFNLSVVGGTYYIWGLVEREPTGGSNSFYIAASGGTKVAWGTPVGEFAWVWERYTVPFILSAGTNYIEISGRESYSKLDRIVVTDDPSFVPGQEPLQIRVYERLLGGVTTFAWDWTPTIICSYCDNACQNCQTTGVPVEVSTDVTTVQCGITTFSLAWNWPSVTVIGGCKGPVTYTYGFKFFGIRTSDGITVFQGVTSDKQISIQFLFGEGLIRLEVAATITSDGITNESRYATSIDSGSPGPWQVLARISDPYEVSIALDE